MIQDSFLRRRRLLTVLGVLVLAAGAFVALGGPALFPGEAALPSNPPAAIQHLRVVPDDAQAFVASFSLTDQEGVPTVGAGRLVLRITEDDATNSILYRQTLTMTVQDFHRTTVGTGTSGQEVLLADLGRIPYSAFSHPPTVGSGQARIAFYPTDVGAILEANVALTFVR